MSTETGIDADLEQWERELVRQQQKQKDAAPRAHVEDGEASVEPTLRESNRQPAQPSTRQTDSTGDKRNNDLVDKVEEVKHSRFVGKENASGEQRSKSGRNRRNRRRGGHPDASLSSAVKSPVAGECEPGEAGFEGKVKQLSEEESENKNQGKEEEQPQKEKQEGSAALRPATSHQHLRRRSSFPGAGEDPGVVDGSDVLAQIEPSLSAAAPGGADPQTDRRAGVSALEMMRSLFLPRLEASNRQSQQLKRRVHELESEVDKVEAENAHLREFASRAQEEGQQATMERDSLVHQLEVLEGEAEEVTNQLREENAQLQASLEEMQQRVEESQLNTQQWEQRSAENAGRVEELQRRLLELEQQNATMKGEQEQLQQRGAKLESEGQRAEEQLRQKDAEIAEIQRSLGEERKKSQSRKADLKEARQVIQQLKKAELERKKKEEREKRWRLGLWDDDEENELWNGDTQSETANGSSASKEQPQQQQQQQQQILRELEATGHLLRFCQDSPFFRQRVARLDGQIDEMDHRLMNIVKAAKGLCHSAQRFSEGCSGLAAALQQDWTPCYGIQQQQQELQQLNLLRRPSSAHCTTTARRQTLAPPNSTFSPSPAKSAAAASVEGERSVQDVKGKAEEKSQAAAIANDGSTSGHEGIETKSGFSVPSELEACSARMAQMLRMVQNMAQRLESTLSDMLCNQLQEFHRNHIKSTRDHALLVQKYRDEFESKLGKYLQPNEKTTGFRSPFKRTLRTRGGEGEDAVTSLVTSRKIFEVARLEHVHALNDVFTTRTLELVQLINASFYGLVTFFHEGEDAVSSFTPDIQRVRFLLGRRMQALDGWNRSNGDERAALATYLSRGMEQRLQDSDFVMAGADGEVAVTSMGVDTDAVVHQGYLYKLSASNIKKEWQRRWFVLLKNGDLNYYKEEGHCLQVKPRHVAAVQWISICREPASAQSSGLNYCFEIASDVATAGANRHKGVWLLQAESEAEKWEWIEQLEQMLLQKRIESDAMRRNVPVPSNSSTPNHSHQPSMASRASSVGDFMHPSSAASAGHPQHKSRTSESTHSMCTVSLNSSPGASPSRPPGRPRIGAGAASFMHPPEMEPVTEDVEISVTSDGSNSKADQ